MKYGDKDYKASVERKLKREKMKHERWIKNVMDIQGMTREEAEDFYKTIYKKPFDLNFNDES